MNADTPTGRGSPQTGPEITAEIVQAANEYCGAYGDLAWATPTTDVDALHATLAAKLCALIAVVRREKGPEPEPVAYSVSYEGEITGNLAVTREGIQKMKDSLDQDHPKFKHLREIVPLYRAAVVPCAPDEVVVVMKREDAEKAISMYEQWEPVGTPIVVRSILNAARAALSLEALRAAPTREAAGLEDEALLYDAQITLHCLAKAGPDVPITVGQCNHFDRLAVALHEFRDRLASRARAPEGTWTAEDAKDIAVAVAYAANHYASKDHAMRLMHLAERIDAAALWQITEGEHGSAVRSGAPGEDARDAALEEAARVCDRMARLCNQDAEGHRIRGRGARAEDSDEQASVLRAASANIRNLATPAAPSQGDSKT